MANYPPSKQGRRWHNAIASCSVPAAHKISHDWAQLGAVELVTECPYKGYADRYWRLAGSGDSAVDAGQEVAWSYSDPFHEVSAIRGLIAYYNERLELTVDGAPFLDSRRTWA